MARWSPVVLVAVASLVGFARCGGGSLHSTGSDAALSDATEPSNDGGAEVVDAAICPVECASDEECVEEICCPIGWSVCVGVCVDLATDLDNCGACGESCSTGAVCGGGDCIISMSGNLSGLISFPGAVVVINGDITVTPYNGADEVSTCDIGETGCLRIEAREIFVNAGRTIDAGGAGYGGGGGGGGGAGNSGPGTACDGTCSSCTFGAPGGGVAGGHNGVTASSADGASTSGGGGSGGGSHGGSGGSGVVSGSTTGPVAGNGGGAGGYAAAASNGDSSVDESLRMGGGGGGGGGGASAYEPFYSSVGGSGGGGAGNRGGGYVVLVASDRLVMDGAIASKGRAAAAGSGGPGSDGQFGGWPCDLQGSGGNGGHASAAAASAGGNGVAGYFVNDFNTCIDRQCGDNGSGAVLGGDGGGGGAGAGGGVLLKAPVVELGGTVDATGGLAASNGGTVKVFHQGAAPATAGISAGRTFVQAY